MKTHSASAPLALLLLAAGLAAPAYAQEAAADPAAAAPAADAATPPEAAPADSAAPAGDAAATEAAPADAAATDATAETSTEAGTETAASDGDGSEASSSSGSEPFYLYGGVDFAALTTSLSKDSLKNALGGDDFDSNFYRLRIGTRIFPSIGVEAQFGIKNEDGSDPGKVETNEMYGLYVVPTGTLFRFVEISAPIGYSHLKLQNDVGSVNFDSLSFGLNVEFPIYVNPESAWPDVRIGGGGTVFYAEREARTYGYHAGIRLDFKI